MEANTIYCKHGVVNFCSWCYQEKQAADMQNIYRPKEADPMDGQILKTGEKKDEGKPRMELLPYDVLTAVARILTEGAKKYDSRNWEKGIEYGRIFGAATRHLVSFWNAYLDGGSGINEEDGNESHLDHALTELMFLSAYEKRGMKAFDDRPRKNA